MRFVSRVVGIVLLGWVVGSLHAEDGPVFMAGCPQCRHHTADRIADVGYGARHDKPAEGVLDPLEANAMVIAVGDNKLAFVGLDMGRPPMRKSFQRIREEIKKQAGVEHVFIVGSHTHHGTCVEIENIPSKENSYQRKFEDGIIEAIVQAERKKVPAKFGVGRVQTVNRNRNRHTSFSPLPLIASSV